MVRRCDRQGCDRIEVDVTISGAFVSLEQRNGPWFARLEPQFLGGREGEVRFVEVPTLGLTTLVYYGSCPLAVMGE